MPHHINVSIRSAPLGTSNLLAAKHSHRVCFVVPPQGMSGEHRLETNKSIEQAKRVHPQRHAHNEQ